MTDSIASLKKELLIRKVYDADSVAEKMYRFMEMVLERNETINLTAITDKEEFINKHLLDSISTYGFREILIAKSIVDIGTGAGFPGIPLALCYPKKQFLLIDSLAKRIDFINEAISCLKISNVTAMHIRAEDAGRNNQLRENFDLSLTRAVAPFNVLLEYCLPLIKPQGSLFAYKTKKAISEIEESVLALRLLGASPDVRIESYERGASTKIETCKTSEAIVEKSSSESPYSLKIFIVKKLHETPSTYPRKAGLPKKIPL